MREMNSKQEDFDPLKLENQLCFPMYACAKEIVRRYRPYLDELGITYTQYITMMVMWEHEKIISTDLSAYLHLDYGTLTPVLKKLETMGMIKRRRAAKDERLLEIELTDAGRGLREKAGHIPGKMSGLLGLSAKEAKTLYDLLYKTLAYMEEH